MSNNRHQDNTSILSVIQYEMAHRYALGQTWSEIATAAGLVNDRGEPDFGTARRIAIGDREPSVLLAESILRSLGYSITVSKIDQK